ncbi:MAG: hypothetical protein DHS20C17_30530 [Cyclobacteriaceae bacterium]|nr:MAG: hypothetical protein DHS20C17_30530 [Cyclobacteriaceae bacterium]
MSSELLKVTLASLLPELNNRVGNHFGIIGVDGFVDKIQQPVKSQDISGSSYYHTLDSFGRRISEASDQSAQIELHTNTVKLGGNAPIFANALAGLAVKNLCLGTFGVPTIHPVFKQMHADCQLISLGAAAETNALEFNDGKLILSELSTFSNLDWEQIKTQINLKHLASSASKAGLIGLVDWCNLPHASDIWLGFLQDIVMPSVGQAPRFFFDLADPSKKAASDVRQVLSLIDRFSGYGNVILGLNENEALKLTEFLGLEVSDMDDHQRLLKIGRLLFNFMNIQQLLIHPIDGCFLFNATDQYYLDGRLVHNPRVSTGGGDNFNAGFCFGELNGYSSLQSMALAMATSGAYVQNGRSPDLDALGDYLIQWQQEL